MRRYLLRRLTASAIGLIGLVVAAFFLIRLVPGTVVEQMLGLNSNYTNAQYEAVRAFFGLNQPLPIQFAHWFGGLVRGDLGMSWRLGEPVVGLILSRMSSTIELAVLSLLAGGLLGIPLGIVAALRQNTWVDLVARLISSIGLAIPEFWQGTLMLLFTSVVLRWVPPLTVPPFMQQPAMHLLAYLLPVLSLALVLTANVARMARTTMLEVMHSDFVRTARAKGLTNRGVTYRHALRNVLIPLITVMGLQLGYLLGGALIIEEIFSLPGIGRLLIFAIQNRDYPLVQGVLLVIGAFFMLINLTVDLLYAAVDPRVKLQ